MTQINESIEKAKTMHQSELQDAIQQLDGVINILPDNTEIQNLRKTLQLMMEERFPKTSLQDIFGETLSQQAQNMKDVVPDKTIYQFIEDLKTKT